MIYCQTINVERIAVHPLDNINNTQYVELMKYGNAPLFAVWMNDGEDDWFWEFEMFNPSDYERVKMNIFDAIFACDTMFELAEALNAIFENNFEDILVVDECNSSDVDECSGCDNYDGCYRIKH